MTDTLVIPKVFQQGGEALLAETATRLAECLAQLNRHKHQPISFPHEILMTRTLGQCSHYARLVERLEAENKPLKESVLNEIERVVALTDVLCATSRQEGFDLFGAVRQIDPDIADVLHAMTSK